MHKTLVLAVSAGVLTLGAISCSSNNGGVADVTLPGHVGSVVPTPQPTAALQYTQIELLSRPAVKEVFETFAKHQVTNASEPYNDPTIQASIKGTEDFVRPPNSTAGTDYGAALAGVLYPNVLIADVGNTSDPGTYLGVETGGATGGKFGGRDPGNDVIKISLGAIFGNTLSALGLIKDDGEENNCLTNDNVAQKSSQAAGTTFPYLAAPH